MKKNALNFAVFMTLLVSYIVLLSSPTLLSSDFFSDLGVVSFLNLALICCGLGLCLFLAMDNRGSKRLHWFLLAYVYIVYLLREADFHTNFTGESLTRLATYSMTSVPFEIRFIAAVVLLIMAAILIYFLICYTGAIIKGILSGENWSIAFLLWFTLLLLSQIFDRSISTSGTHWKLTAIEELLEISAAIFAVLAIIQLAAMLKNNLSERAV